MYEREIVKVVTKCIRVNSFINMVRELKNTLRSTKIMQ